MTDNCVQQNDRNCCQESDYLCNWLPRCVQEIRYIHAETVNPSDDRKFEVDDIVLLDKSLQYDSDILYGKILKVTDKTAQVFSNGGTLERRHKKNLQKLRPCQITEAWSAKIHLDYQASIYVLGE